MTLDLEKEMDACRAASSDVNESLAMPAKPMLVSVECREGEQFLHSFSASPRSGNDSFTLAGWIPPGRLPSGGGVRHSGAGPVLLLSAGLHARIAQTSGVG